MICRLDRDVGLDARGDSARTPGRPCDRTSQSSSATRASGSGARRSSRHAASAKTRLGSSGAVEGDQGRRGAGAPAGIGLGIVQNPAQLGSERLSGDREGVADHAMLFVASTSSSAIGPARRPVLWFGRQERQGKTRLRSSWSPAFSCKRSREPRVDPAAIRGHLLDLCRKFGDRDAFAGRARRSRQ